MIAYNIIFKTATLAYYPTIEYCHCHSTRRLNSFSHGHKLSPAEGELTEIQVDFIIVVLYENIT